MHTADIIAREDAFQIPTYNKMPLALARGAGCYVWDTEGQRYLDFYGGHCVTLLGHCPPAVVSAVQAQAATLLFYSNLVYSPVRADAAALLAEMAPEGLGHVFFGNSGAEANETALKIARKATGRMGLVAMEGGFHGRTLGSLAATWNPTYRAPYADILPDTTFIPFGDTGALAQVLTARDDIGAVILEPIQSMAGMQTATPEYAQALRRLCDHYGVCLIFDEVQTGVGRTGTFSISTALGMRPDLITMAKSLGSGLPVGATLVSDALAATVAHGDQGSTFGGGMVAMAAVHATLTTLRDEGLLARAPALFARLRDGVAPYVAEVRGQGCLIGLVLDTPARPVIEALRAQGVLVGGAADPQVIRLMPPINSPDDAVESFLEAFEHVMTTHPA